MGRGFNVRVIDNLSSESIRNIERWLGHPRFTLLRGDLLRPEDIAKVIKDCKVVYHLAANPEVRTSYTSPDTHFQENVLTTYNLLEVVRKTGKINTLVFTSPSTVYGEAVKIPTFKDYAPLEPISVYGATKLACEALITSYAHMYGFRAVIYRLVNVIGPRSQRGVIHDFVQKLKGNPKELEVLGNGEQRKSYLYVDDCVRALLLGGQGFRRQVEVFNLGSEDWVDVKTIAEIVIEEMGLEGVKLRFTGGVNGGRGWKGDVKDMLLDVRKIMSLGWRPSYNSAEAVRLSVRALLKEHKLTHE